MVEKELLEHLRGVGFLHGFSEEHLERLAQFARLLAMAEGQVIFREGEPTSNIYLIVRGNVSLEICAPGVGCRRILTASEGDLLGLSPVLEQVRLTSTARALTPVELIEINGGQIIAMCEHDPRFGYIFMRRFALALAMRLNATRMQLLDVFGERMPTVDHPEASDA
jgi:CRP-like cAMP-binding protein